MALQDTDLFLVNRNGLSYKITASELRDGLGPTNIAPSPGDVISTPTFLGGIGTPGDPFILAPAETSVAGSSAQSVELITIANNRPGDRVTWTDNSVGADNRFSQPVGTVDINGKWTGHLVYVDTPDTLVETAYTGDLQIGSTHFRWVVTQKLVPPLAVVTPTTFTGTENVGQVLTATAGTANGGTGTISYATRWQRSDTGIDGWADIAGATNLAYTLVAADGNKYVRAVTTATDQTTPVAQTLDIPSASSGQIGTSVPPLIASVTLAEDNPGAAPAFTSQSFTTTYSMTNDGVPSSLKALKGWVQGTLKKAWETSPIVNVTASSGDTWTEHPLDVTGSNWDDIAWSPSLGLFAIVGDGGVMTSSDGATWTKVDARSGLRGIAWSPELGVFAVVSRNGDSLLYSTDGITWRTATNPSYTWGAVAWSPSLGVFCAITSDSGRRSMTSPDGINWTAHGNASLTASKYYGIAWSPKLNLFAAVADEGRAATSPDGINWTMRSLGTTGAWQDVVWSPELEIFCAVANGGTARSMVSSDGINWTFGSTSISGNAVAWSAPLGSFVAVGAYNGTDAISYSSTNGINWVPLNQAGGTASTQVGIEWSDSLGLFAVAAQTNSVARTSTAPGISITELVFDNDTNLDKATPGLAVTENGNGDDGTGQILSVNIAGPSMRIGAITGTWNVGSTAIFETAEAGTKLFIQFDASGTVSNLVSSDPGFTIMANQANPKITFPAVLPSGNAPDVDLPDGTTITTYLQASNAAGTVDRASNTVTPTR